jgi:hypothetical protein
MKKLPIAAIVVLMLSCDHGLEPPPPVVPGFGGTVYFQKDTWPVADSLFSLWVFASEVYPLDSVKVIQGLLYSNPPTIFLYPSSDKNLPFFVDSVTYSFDLPPSTYKYVGVIQRFANDLNVHSLRVVGVYGTNDTPPIPIPVIVSSANFVTGIDIKVNFLKPPPAPF